MKEKGEGISVWKVAQTSPLIDNPKREAKTVGFC